MSLNRVDRIAELGDHLDASRMSWCEQRSDYWLDLRKCFVTASDFGAVLGVNPYKTIDSMLQDMQTERKMIVNANMQWGIDHEQDAVVMYQHQYLGFQDGEKRMKFPGMMVDKDGKLAASPDGLVDDDGIIEVKCPASRSFYKEIPKYHIAQVKGLLGVSGRKWCDYVQWIPGAIHDTRFMHDPEDWAFMKEALEDFFDNSAYDYYDIQYDMFLQKHVLGSPSRDNTSDVK